MKAVLRILLICALAAAAPVSVPAVQPDEILPDPALEARARAISREIRCLVCRNESIDESNADLARDLRILVRERLQAGDSDEAVTAYLVERYGDFVLLRPRLTGANLVLWSAPVALLLLGGIVAVVFVRQQRRQPAPASTALNAEEEARLQRILARDAEDR